jgi:hypothetical protein
LVSNIFSYRCGIGIETLPHMPWVQVQSSVNWLKILLN